MSIVIIILAIAELIIVIGLTTAAIKSHLKLKEQQISIDFLEGEAEAVEHGYNALMKDFNNYQVETDRKIAHLEKQLEIKDTSTNKKIDKIKKELPSIVRNVVGHIEFAQPLDKK
jgi:uncharacterized protein YoxC